jgi:carbonic anhydrase
MSLRDEILTHNAAYASRFENGHLEATPARRFAVVTCMDARLDPAKFLGLAEGDAHVIRNAGAIVTDDVLRSLVISHWLLGTQQAIVVAHRECGMLTFTNEELQQKLADNAGSGAADVDFQPFRDLEESVRSSVRRIRASALLPESFAAAGFVYDPRNGRLGEVEVPNS